jgi:tRNA(fMet)-specific endonuclease VapC
VKVLLDTNAYSALMRGHSQVSTLVRRSTEVLLSAVVVGELLYGFRHGSRFERNAEQLRDFLGAGSVQFLAVGQDTADRFGRIAAALRRAGKPIPSNDLWIAAHTLEHGADLLSADRHFETVPGLVLRRFDL